MKNGNTGSQGRVVEVYSMEIQDQVASSTLKRSITQREEEGEVIEMDGDVTRPSTSNQSHRTLTDRLMKRSTVEEFINTWIEVVFGKGLTLDFFNALLPKRSTRTQKNLPQTDVRL
jgi:hypothetical protein